MEAEKGSFCLTLSPDGELGLRAELHRSCPPAAFEGEEGLTAEAQRGLLVGERAVAVAEAGWPRWQLSEGTDMSCSMSSTAAISCQLPAATPNVTSTSDQTVCSSNGNTLAHWHEHITP